MGFYTTARVPQEPSFSHLLQEFEGYCRAHSALFHDSCLAIGFSTTITTYCNNSCLALCSCNLRTTLSPFHSSSPPSLLFSGIPTCSNANEAATDP